MNRYDQDDRPRPPRRVRKGRHKTHKVRKQTSAWIEVDNLQIHLLSQILTYIDKHKGDCMSGTQMRALIGLQNSLIDAREIFDWEYTPHGYVALEEPIEIVEVTGTSDLLP